MSDAQIKQEIKNLIKIGLPEDMALLVASAKFNKTELAHDVLQEQSEENDILAQSIEYFKPMEIHDLNGVVLHGFKPNMFCEVSDWNGKITPLEITENGGANPTCVTINCGDGLANGTTIFETMTQVLEVEKSSDDNTNDTHEITDI
jgi:hypothetical protein